MTPASTGQPSPSTKDLDDIDLFAGLSPEELRQLFTAARQHRLETGSFVYMEADPADTIYALVSGRVKLTQVTPNGQQILLKYVSPGEAFGVVSVLSDTPYPVSAQADSEVVVYAWDQTSMQRLMSIFPGIALNAIQILAGRVRLFQDRLRELATERVERRIARTLLRLARQTGKKVQEGVLIDMPLTRQDLAEMTGTTLYTVSRTLSQWETQGLVHSSRERILIRYPHGLVSIAEDLPKDSNPI